MKIKKLFAVISAVSFLAVGTVSFRVFAEEAATEAVTTTDTTETIVSTDAVEESTEAITSTDTTESTEETAIASKTIILAEVGGFDEWANGDFSKTFELSNFGYDFGSFTSLILNGASVDSSNYSVAQNGNENITLTLRENFMSTLSEGSNYFTIDFEKVTMQSAFAVNVLEKNESEVETQVTIPAANNAKISSPKTGDSRMSSIFGLLTISGITALFSKKMKFTK